MTGKEREGNASEGRRPDKPADEPDEATATDIAPMPRPKPPGTAVDEPPEGDTTFAAPASAPASPEPS